MKKEVLLISSLFLLSVVSAISGVSPGSYNVDFWPGLEKNFTFNFIFDEGVNSKLSISNDLSEFATLDNYLISGTQKVTLFLKLPEQIENYGQNKIRISAKELNSDNQGISIISDVSGIVNVLVPYPWEYYQIKLEIPDGTIEELLNISLVVKNLGNLSVKTSPAVQIFNGQDLVQIVTFNENMVAPLQQITFSKQIGISNFSVGEYSAVALLDCNGTYIRDDKFFRIGKFEVEINDYTKIIKKTNPSQISFNLTNLWNREIDLNADLIVGGEKFTSPSIKINSGENKNLTIYFNAEQIKNTQNASIILYYGGKISETKINLEFENNYQKILIILLILFAIVITYLALRRS